MKLEKLKIGLAIGGLVAATCAFAGTTYGLPHGALIGGEATVVDNAGAKIFFPAAVSGTLIASPNGAIVKTDVVSVAGNNLGTQVRSTITVPPRSGMSSVYVDTIGRVYLQEYNAYSADGSNATSLLSKPILLDVAKYPGLASAQKIFSTYSGGASASTYYQSGSSLYLTTALKPGSANSATASLVTENVLGVIGVDNGVFVLGSGGVTFYDINGNPTGMSTVISSAVTASEFATITQVHPSLYVIGFANGTQAVFNIDGSVNTQVSATNKIGFIPYFSRSAQVAGHNGQTTFAWYTADYKISYVDPYASAASAIKSIDWSLQTGTKSPISRTIKFLSVSEDGFVQYTGRNSGSTTYYLHVGASSSVMSAISTTSSTTASDASNASASSVAWNNPSNPNWHYKVPPASFGNSGSKSYYWKWGLSGGKITLSRTSATNAVTSFGGGGRICRLASTYYVASTYSTTAGSGTEPNGPFSGPTNGCGASAVTANHANAADGQSGFVSVGADDGAYIDKTSGAYVKSGTLSDLSTTGAPGSVSGSIPVPAGFSGSTGWDARHNLLFGVDDSGIPYIAGHIFDATKGSSKFVNLAFANDFVGTASQASSATEVALNWNDPRDSRSGVTTWNVTTSRMVSTTAYDTLTQAGVPSGRTLTVDSGTAGFAPKFAATADLQVPVIGHRGAKITLNSPQFTGTLDRPPTITIAPSVNVNSNVSGFVVPFSINDPDAGDILTLKVTSQPAHGTVVISNGQFLYTPSSNYFGPDAFTVQVADGAGASVIGTANLNVVCPAPTITGMTFDMTQMGPYRGATANLSYQSNTCNGGLGAYFQLKKNGNLVAGTVQSLSMADGEGKVQPFVVDNLVPGVYEANVRVTSANNAGFLEDVVSSNTLSIAPNSLPVLGISKLNPTEDDAITVSATSLPLCQYYDSVSGARLNKGCNIEWSSSAGVVSTTYPAENQIRFYGLRGAQSVTALVKAYNTDGNSFALSPVTLDFNVAAPIDVTTKKTFSKGGPYTQLLDKFGLVIEGEASNLCSLAATDVVAQSIVDGGGKACVVEFTQLPAGVKQDPGTLSLSGRLIDGGSNNVSYKISRYYGPGLKALINTETVPVLTTPTAILASVNANPSSFSGGLTGMAVSLNIGGDVCSQTALAAEAKASWSAVGAPKCLVEWTVLPTGTAEGIISGKPGIQGVPLSSGDQVVGYKLSFVTDTDSKIELANQPGIVIDKAPVLSLPSNTVVLDANTVGFVIPTFAVSDPDVGDVLTSKIVSSPTNGSASINNGVLSYSPAPSYIGMDSIGVSVTDKFGVTKTGTVALNVVCGMPTTGTVVSPFAAGFWAGKPVDITASFSPADACHGGFDTKLEVMNGPTVARTITPTSTSASTDVNGKSVNNFVFDNTALSEGSYGTRLRVKSLMTGNEVVFAGDQLIVVPVSAPSLSIDKVSPSEHDDIIVSATSVPLCSYYASVSEARLNRGCYIDWSASVGVKSMATNIAGQARIAAIEGSNSVTAIVKAYESDGSFYALPATNVSFNVAKGVDIPIGATYNKMGAYTQMLDRLTASFEATNSLCILSATEGAAQAVVDAGNHACTLDFTFLPNGLTQNANSLSVSGRLVNESGNNVGYQVYRYYAPGVKQPINSGSVSISTVPFSPTIAVNVNAENISGKGYSASLDITSPGWSCTQTGSVNDAKASWSSTGEAKCLVEWSSLRSGISIANVGGLPGIRGIPSASGNQLASYAVSLVDEGGNRYQIGNAINKLLDSAPVVFVPALSEVATNSTMKPIAGISATDDDVNDAVSLSIQTPPAHGSADFDGSNFTYQPVSGYVGTDSFVIKATDKFGAYATKTVGIDVACVMPTLGGVSSPDASGFYEIQPRTINGRFSPTYGCHLGYQVRFEVLDQNNNVVTYVDSPATSSEGTDQNGAGQQNVTYENVSFVSGTYSSRLRVRSNGIPGKEVYIPGDEFVVKSMPAPSLTADKTTSSEDEPISISASHSICTSFANSEAEAILNKSCFIEWTKTGSVLSLTRNGNSGVTVSGARGVATVRGTIKVPDSSNALRSSGSAEINLTFQTGSSVPVIEPSFASNNYTMIVDFITGGPIVTGGYDCQLVGGINEGKAIALNNGKACLITYTKVPTGMRVTPGNVTFSGRLINAGDKTFEYAVSRVYADGSTASLSSGAFDLIAKPMAIKATIQTSRHAYAAGIQNAFVSLKLDDVSVNSVACPQTSTEAEAMASWDGAGVPKCIISWTSIPNGLALDQTRLALTGIPVSTTNNAIGYTVSFVDGSGQYFPALTGTGALVVRAPVSPNYSITAAHGKFVDTAGGEPYFLVKDDGLIGSVKVLGGDFANINLVAQDIIGLGKRTEASDLASGSSVNIFAATEQVNAWAARNISLALSYDGLADLLTNNVNVRVMRMPPANLIVTTSTPKSVIDTALFKMTMKVGEPLQNGSTSYDRDKHGLWQGYLAERNSLGLLTQLTQKVDINVNDGSFVFDGLDAKVMEGKTVVGVVVPNIPNGSIEGMNYNLQSTPLTINFIPGGELPAILKATKFEGSAPLAVRFDVDMNQVYKDDVYSITWQYSVNGGPWVEMTSVRGFTANYTFSEGGLYHVRAVITNKNTMVVGNTSPVSVLVKQAIKLDMSKNYLTLPGNPVTMNIVATKPDGNPISYVSEWTINRQGSAPEVIRNVNSYVITSSEPAVVSIKVRARPVELPDEDPESWASVSRQVNFAIPEKPRAGIAGAPGVEAGSPIELKANIIPPWDIKTDSNLTVSGKWILPDGSEIPGTDPLIWTPNPADIPSGGVLTKVRYAAWVVGAEAETTVTVDKRIIVRKYEFPRFKLAVRADTTYAPAYIMVTAVPETLQDAKLLAGKKLTYTWSVPEGITARANGARLSGTIDAPGNYVTSVVVSDDRGNSMALDYQFDIAASRPFNMTLKTGLAQKFNRNPARYALKVEVSGGHPKDSVKNFSLFVDGVKIGDTGRRSPSYVDLLTPGTHEIKVGMESMFGAYVEAIQVVDVLANQPPICSATHSWDTRNAFVTIKTYCKDNDGIMKSFTWYVDGVVQEGKTSTAFTWSPPSGITSALISFSAVDDSGSATTVEVPVSR